MNPLQHLANAVAVLLCQREPYPTPYQAPEITSIDTRGHYPVIHVMADNYMDAMRPVEGTTYPGNVHRQVVHTDGRNWEIRVVDNSAPRSDLEETKPRKAVKR